MQEGTEPGAHTSATSIRKKSAVLLGFDVVVLVILGAATASSVLPFREMYEELDRHLPALSRFFLYNPPHVYALGFAGLIAALVVKEFLVKNKSLTLVINIWVMVAGFLYLGVWVVALFLPLVGGLVMVPC